MKKAPLCFSILFAGIMSVGAQEPELEAVVEAGASVPVLHEELMPLFEASLDFYGTLVRRPNGLYADAWRRTGRWPERDGSVAAVGVGLMALCMEHELGRDAEAAAKALQTLRVINGKVEGIELERDGSGFFRHFFNLESGRGKGEVSTIDTAILVVGALYCRNIFDDPEITREADELWGSIDWPLALARADGSELYMIMKEGRPVGDSVTQLFSEYYILVWLIRQWELQHRGESEVLTMEQVPTWSYEGLELFGSGMTRPESSFVVQFPMYMCHPCTLGERYLRFVEAHARADHLTCSRRVGVDEFWGCGAGGTPHNRYYASSFADNPSNVVSPRIIAGFMPVYPVAQEHLLGFYRDEARRMETPVGDLVPRFSVDEPGWRHHRIEAIDFASMLFGLAGVHPELGMEFFGRATRFTFGSEERGKS
jgi:hypothetical protein